MKHSFTISLLFFISIIWSQPIMEMTPQGFEPISFTTPNKTTEKLIEFSRTWANTYNKDGVDISDVTQNSLVIAALKLSAAYYYNIGVQYDYNIRYELKVVFNQDKTYTLTFHPKEFYANEVLTKTTIADFYTSEGKLKDDFRDVKPSLEAMADRIVKSYTNFISN